MTDTNIEVLQRISDGYFPHGAEQRAALDAAITALSARASAGEGGEWVLVPRDAITAAAAELSAQGCKDSASDLLQSMLTAAPQPAQAGASGGGEDRHADASRGRAQEWVMVPREPTPEMKAAWSSAQPKGFGTGYSVTAGYRAMLAAAPRPQEAPAKGGVTAEMVERACRKYAFREDGAVWPDDYSEHEVAAERVLMREFLEHALSEPNR